MNASKDLPWYLTVPWAKRWYFRLPPRVRYPGFTMTYLHVRPKKVDHLVLGWVDIIRLIFGRRVDGLTDLVVRRSTFWSGRTLG